MKRIRFIILLLLIGIAFLLVPKSVLADESIQNYEVSLTAHRNGIMSVHESIHYDFDTNQKHGIYRFIPLVSQVGNVYRVISVQFTNIQRDGQDENYSVSTSSDTTQVKIGNANQTITGLHIYTINYDVSNGIGSNYADHDEIYWNVTGNEWTVPVNQASIAIRTDFGVLPGKTICYTGITGSTTSNCSITDIANGKKITTTTALSQSDGFTIVSSFPVQTFPKSVLQKDRPVFSPDTITFFKILIFLYILLNLIVAPGLLYWYFKHKHNNRFGQVTVNFDIPEYPKGSRIIPAEAGALDNTKFDKNDIVATIFDLAIRKYIRIEQVAEKGLFFGIGSHNNYTLIKLKNVTDLNEFEKRLMTAVFHEVNAVRITDISFDYSDFSDLETKNFASLIKRKFYTKDPKVQKSILLVFGIVCIVTLNILFGPVLLFLSRQLNGRTALGDELNWNIEGLKLFLKNMSREYKWQAEKTYVVEQMIPYAMAFGYIDEYMKQIKILNPQYQPTWYVGQGSFYSIYPVFNTALSNTITTADPSSSGFSGGFSGGGGGGGGGGSW